MQKGELATRYPRGVPEALARGVEVFDGAFARVKAHDIELDAKERERKRAELQKNATPPRRRR